MRSYITHTRGNNEIRSIQRRPAFRGRSKIWGKKVHFASKTRGSFNAASRFWFGYDAYFRKKFKPPDARNFTLGPRLPGIGFLEHEIQYMHEHYVRLIETVNRLFRRSSSTTLRSIKNFTIISDDFFRLLSFFFFCKRIDKNLSFIAYRVLLVSRSLQNSEWELNQTWLNNFSY